MNELTGVLAQLKEQRAKIDSAISALESLNGTHTNGRPTTKSGFVRTRSASAKRIMSPAARRKIAVAQKARWAKWRKQQKAA